MALKGIVVHLFVRRKCPRVRLKAQMHGGRSCARRGMRRRALQPPASNRWFCGGAFEVAGKTAAC